MAFEEYDDYEQSERVQQWLRQNGVSIIVGIALGLLLIFGWQQWKVHRANHRAEASGQFTVLKQALTSGKQAEADATIATLKKDYGDTPYAVFALALQARYDVQDKKFDKAITSLTWAEQHAEKGPVKGLMQLRLARVELAAGKADEALKVLDRMPKSDYQGLAQELRGDVLVKLGQSDAARTAYQASLAAFGEDAPQRGGVQLKLDNLAKAGKQGA